MLPTEIAFQVRRDQIWQSNAANAISGRSQSHIMEIVNQDMTPEFLAAMQVQIDELERQPETVQHFLRTKLGIQYVETMLLENKGMQLSIDAIFSSILLDSWTAFECLAGDLWTSGVDNGPSDIMGRLIVADSQLQKPDDNIKIGTIGAAEADPKKQFGSFLREIGKVSFQKLESIRAYYGIAFGNEAKQLFDTTDNGYIVVLSAFRNIITHSASQADRKFTKKVERFPEFSHIKSRDRVELDGELVKRLRYVSLNLGNALLHLVDDVISPLPTAGGA